MTQPTTEQLARSSESETRTGAPQVRQSYDDFVTAGDIAKLWGTRHSNVCNTIERHRSFPKPLFAVGNGYIKVYSKEAVMEWRAAQLLKKKSRRPWNYGLTYTRGPYKKKETSTTTTTTDKAKPKPKPKPKAKPKPKPKPKPKTERI